MTTAMATTSTDIHAKILAYVAGAFAMVEHHSPIKVELIYAPSGTYRGEPMKAWGPENSPELFGDHGHARVNHLVSEILEIAENYADSFGSGRHRFVIRVHQALGGRTTSAFTILPSFDNDDQAASGQGGDAPTEKGLVGQLMRHLETRDRNGKEMLQAVLGAMSQSMGQLRDENTDLRGQINGMVKERVDWMAKIEEAASKEHDRQIEAMQATAKEERKTNATNKIVNLLPVFLSQYLGSGAKKPGDPKRPPSPLAKLVGELVESLSEDQRGQLGDILSMEQQITMGEIVKVVQAGDSMLLPAMLADFAGSLTPKQGAAIFATMQPEQQAMFAKAIQLATAQTETKNTTANGAAQTEAS